MGSRFTVLIVTIPSEGQKEHTVGVFSCPATAAVCIDHTSAILLYLIPVARYPVRGKHPTLFAPTSICTYQVQLSRCERSPGGPPPGPEEAGRAVLVAVLSCGPVLLVHL